MSAPGAWQSATPPVRATGQRAPRERPADILPPMPKNVIIAVLTVLLGLSVAFALAGANTDDDGCDPVCQ